MYWVGVITAGITAFYVFRAFFLAFFGEYRGHHHPHESPASMTLPLIVLAAFSLGGGFLSVPNWLAPMFPRAETENITLAIVSVAAGLIGILLAFVMYVAKPKLADALASASGPLYQLTLHKYYVDELYDALIVRPLEQFSRTVLWKGADNVVIDGAVDGGGRRFRGVGAILRQMQSGSIRNYATWVMAGSLLILIVLGLAGGAR